MASEKTIRFSISGIQIHNNITQEFKLRISDEDYEYFLSRAKKICENYKKADSIKGDSGKEYPPEILVEMAVKRSINRHILVNLNNFLEESEQELSRLASKK